VPHILKIFLTFLEGIHTYQYLFDCWCFKKKNYSNDNGLILYQWS